MLKKQLERFLGKYIVNEYYQQKQENNHFNIDQETTFEKDYRGLIGLLRKIWDKVKALFRGQSANKELNRIIKDVFGQEAKKILTGETIQDQLAYTPKHNRAIIFQSNQCLHAVNETNHEGDFKDSRFSINLWLGFPTGVPGDPEYRYKE